MVNLLVVKHAGECASEVSENEDLGVGCIVYVVARDMPIADVGDKIVERVFECFHVDLIGKCANDFVDVVFRYGLSQKVFGCMCFLR